MIMHLKKQYRVLLVLFLFVVCFTAVTHAAANDPHVLKLAAANVVSKGKFTDHAGGTGYLTKDGKYLKKTWAKINGSVYYFDASGKAATGIFTYKDCKFYAYKNGKLQKSKKFTYKGKIYCALKTGALASSEWVKIDGRYYYFRSSGVMAVNSWIGDRYVRHDGVRVYGLSKKEITQTETKSEKKNGRRLIIIGASRVYQMKRDAQNTANALYICKPSQGYSWFAGNAVHKMKALLALYPNSSVVIQMGNNDLRETKDGRIAKYISLYNQLMQQYPKAKFFFMDTLPGDPDRSEARNKRRQAFNQKLKDAFPVNWIGGYHYLLASNPQFTPGGAHYKPATNRKLYRYILNRVGWK